MKKLIGLIIAIVLVVVLAGRVFATEEVTDLETSVEEVTELETNIPSDTSGTSEESDPGIVDTLKNTLTTVLEQSEKARTVYYIVSTCSTLVSVIVLIIISKKNKKHNSEITKEIGEHIDVLYGKQISDSITVIEQSIQPILTQVYKTQEAVVKSIALLHLNDDKSAVASLECLSNVLSDDARLAVADIKHNLKMLLDAKEESRNQIEKELTNLVEKAEKEITGGRTFIQDLSKRIL